MFDLLRRNRNYRLLFASAAITNLGDGISALAFPWLATLITRDPFLISLTAVATRLPWLLVSLPAGVITDRVSRQQLMIGADLARAAVSLGIVALILAAPALPLADDAAAVPMIGVLCALAFLLGTFEVLRDNAAQTVLPSVVGKKDLEAANGQIWSVEQIMSSFVGPPLAGVLIALAVPLPFIVDAGTFLLAAFGIWLVALPRRPPMPPRRSFVAELAEGITWIRAHPLILRLAVMLGVVNAAAMAGWTMLVLFSQELLVLGAFGHGLLLTAGAAGGVIGGLIAPPVTVRIGGRASVILGLVLFALAYLAIAITSNAFVVGAALFVEMVGAMIWNVFTVSYRQRVIPDDLLGRVNSIYRFFGWGMMPLGALVGGIAVAWLEPGIGREAALRAPYLGAGALMLLLAVAAFPLLPFGRDPRRRV